MIVGSVTVVFVCAAMIYGGWKSLIVWRVLKKEPPSLYVRVVCVQYIVGLKGWIHHFSPSSPPPLLAKSRKRGEDEEEEEEKKFHAHLVCYAFTADGRNVTPKKVSYERMSAAAAEGERWPFFALLLLLRPFLFCPPEHK